MKKVKYIICPIIILLALSFSSYSQLKAQEQIHSGYRNTIKESIILETDQIYYLPGESVKCSFITYDIERKATLEISKIVYLEFFTSDNIIVNQAKAKINNYSGLSTINIPTDLPSGKYYIRAYTNYMKNFNHRWYAISSIYVINPNSFLLDADKNNTIQTNDLRIFPEGGNLILGANNKVSLHLNNGNKNKMYLLEGTDTLMNEITLNEYGIGSFSFNPTSNTNYKIVCSSNEQTLTINDGAINLSENKITNDSIHININKSNFNTFPLWLKAKYKHTDFSICKVLKADTIISISKREIPEGINMFYLIDSLGNIHSYKYFINSIVYEPKVQLKTNKTNYSFREKAELIIEFNKPIKPSYFSVSIINLDSLEINYLKNNIEKTNLSNQLYPYIEHLNIPAYSISKSKHLNPILQTFKIDTTNPNIENYAYLPEFTDDIILGKVEYKNNEVKTNPVIFHSAIDSTAYLSTTIPKQGDFIFTPLHSKHNYELILTHKHTNIKTIGFIPEFTQEFISICKEPILEYLPSPQSLNNRHIYSKIANAYKTKAKTNSKTRPFYLKANKELIVDEYPSFKLFKDFVFEVLPWVTINKKNEILVSYKGTDQIIGFAPLFLVDGIPIFDAEYISQLECKRLKSVSVVYKRVFYQNTYFDGIIDIKSKNGDGSIVDSYNNIVRTTFILAEDESLNNHYVKSKNIPYYRNNLITTQFLKVQEINKVHFFTPDYEGKFLIKCCIIDLNGRKSYYYQTINTQNLNK